MNGEKENSLPVDRTSSRARRAIFGLMLLVAVFLLGYVPSWWKARSAEAQRALLENQLSLTRLHSLLGMVSLEANRNNYHNAADYSNRFFNGLKKAIDNATRAELREKLEAVSANRDNITALLAKADPAVKEILAQMYADFYQIAAPGQ